MVDCGSVSLVFPVVHKNANMHPFPSGVQILGKYVGDYIPNFLLDDLSSNSIGPIRRFIVQYTFPLKAPKYIGQ